MATESKLWQDVNSLGGAPSNDYERGIHDAIDQSLTLIERSGHQQLIDALKLTTGAVVALMKTGFSETSVIRFTGDFDDMGSVTVGAVLDAAIAALGLSAPATKKAEAA